MSKPSTIGYLHSVAGALVNLIEVTVEARDIVTDEGRTRDVLDETKRKALQLHKTVMDEIRSLARCPDEGNQA